MKHILFVLLMFLIFYGGTVALKTGCVLALVRSLLGF